MPVNQPQQRYPQKTQTYLFTPLQVHMEPKRSPQNEDSVIRSFGFPIGGVNDQSRFTRRRSFEPSGSVQRFEPGGCPSLTRSMGELWGPFGFASLGFLLISREKPTTTNSGLPQGDSCGSGLDAADNPFNLYKRPGPRLSARCLRDVFA